MDMKQAQNAAEKFRHSPEHRPGVVSVGYGFKRKGGQITDIPCVVVFVTEKRPLSALTPAEAIPQMVDDVPTDVVQIKTVPALIVHVENPRFIGAVYPQRKRPCPGGFSIGHPLVTAGTLGLPVVMKDGQQALLSNTHVIAPHWATDSSGQAGEVKAGDPILQPGPYDGGREKDTIAFLRSWAPIDFSGQPNRVDGALALVREDVVDWRIEALSPVYEKAGEPQPGKDVAKVGRTTGLTKGRITVVGAAVRVDYGGGRVALFTDQLEIVSTSPDGSGFSRGGDSGSAILSQDGKEVLGLLFAGDDTTTYANPIALVQQALGFDIVPRPVGETIQEQLAGLAESLVTVWGYDAKTQQWLVYDPLAPDEVSTLKVLEKAKGYWVKVARDISFNYHEQTYDLVAGWNLMGWIN